MIEDKIEIYIKPCNEENNKIEVCFKYEPSGHFSFNNLTYFVNDKRIESETFSSLYDVNLKHQNSYKIKLDNKENCSSIYFRLKDRITNEYYGVRVPFGNSKTIINKEEK